MPDQRIVVPAALAPSFVKEFHEGTHLGKNATEKALGRWVQEWLPVSLTTPVHPFRPGDQVWVKSVEPERTTLRDRSGQDHI